jgi:Asp-tRNA(Asn)/Glu-tRNA(Gln) amidotransferase B subunit
MRAAFEAIVAAAPDLSSKEVANLVTGDYGRALKETPERTAAGLAGRAEAAELAALLRRVVAGELSRANAREVLADHLATGEAVAAIVDRRGVRQVSDATALGPVVDEVLASNGPAVGDYRAGKAQALGFLVGQVMKRTAGRANPGLVNRLLAEKLPKL